MTVWDLLVVGGGAAGIVGAKTAASLGARVLLVEQDRTGGDCLWTGCVPSKTLIAQAGQGAGFGAATRAVRAAVAAIAPVDSPAALDRAGVTVRVGNLRFTGRGTAVVDGATVRFRQALVATGAAPVVPPIPGLAQAPVVTSETVWDLAELPRRLLVLGGGSIGCELAQAFARLGSEVTLVEAAPRLLTTEHPDAAAIVAAALAADGVRVHVGTRATGFDGSQVLLDNGNSLGFDQVLVAAGRAPRTAGLGLNTIGVEVNDRGEVVVDSYQRTSNPRVWAAGDVTNRPKFTHTAGVLGSLAASNAVLGVPRRANLAAVPRVTFTDPEVAAVGVDDWEGSLPGLRARRVEHHDLDRAVTEGATNGFSRLVLDKKGRVVGATVVSPRAGETIGELTLAVRLGLRARDLASTIHPYPTFNDGPWNAAIADVREQVAAPRARWALGRAVATRRLWLRLRG